MSETYWLVHANGGRQWIDPRLFDLDRLAEQAMGFGGRLECQAAPKPAPFLPPASAHGALLRERLARIHRCRIEFTLDLKTRPTKRVLGNYYKTRRLIRIYTHDHDHGPRPFEEVFETFLHEVAHHLEYTEYDVFEARACGRRKGTMHSDLFWRILGELKGRWSALQPASS